MTARRVDVEIVRRGLAPSREAARAAILAGEVKVNGARITKAGAPVTSDAVIEVSGGRRYVSRGGLKLEGALDRFGIDPAGCAVLDVGASTGGFTDCVLRHGAASVTAVDVGYGQLDWRLRNDQRVRVLERTNIRSVSAETLGGPYRLIVIDVSFIGLAKIFPALVPLLADDGSCLALVKPQFEAGKGRVGKKGVVRDPAVHRDALVSVCDAIAGLGWVVRGLGWSSIIGPEGNIEFWVWSAPHGDPATELPETVVRAAHESLGV